MRAYYLLEVHMKEAKNKKEKKVTKSGGGAAALFMGFIGALVYYLQQAHGFWPVILAFLKACVWPALLVYDLLKFMH